MVRRAHEDELLVEAYHQKLLQEGVAQTGTGAHSLAQCREDYVLATTMARRRVNAALDRDGLARLQAVNL